MPLAEYGLDLEGFGFGEDTRYCGKIVSGLGPGAKRARQYENPGDDGITFGREFRNGKQITFEGSVTGTDAMAAVLALESVWNGAAVRVQPKVTQTLSFKFPGVAEKTIEGRPGEFDYDITFIGDNIILWSATFDAATP